MVKHEQYRDSMINKFNMFLEGLIILSGEQESPVNGDKKEKKINTVKVGSEMITLWKRNIGINTRKDRQLFNVKKITGSTTTRYGLAIKIYLDQKLEENSYPLVRRF